MEPNDALRDLVKGDRPKSLADAAWVRGMLADLCPETEHRRQVNLLVLAQSEGVARDLAVISNGSIDGFAVARLVARLVDNHDTAPESARWAVGRWAEALGVSIAPGIELRPPKSVSGPPPTPPHAAVSAALQSTTEPEPLVPLKQVQTPEPVRPPAPYRLVPDPAPVSSPMSERGAAPAQPADRGAGRVLSPFAALVRWFKPVPVDDDGSRRVIVDGSGRGDFNTIESAYFNAKAGETIVVRPGTYRVSLGIDRNVRIVGEGGRSKVIVQGTAGAHVFTVTSGSATLVGMTIRVTGPGPAGQDWSAIAIRGGLPLIGDCDLTSSAGSAVHIFNSTTNPTVRNCTFRGSRDHGVLVSDRGRATIEKCAFFGNAGSGVATMRGGNPIVRDCEIRDGKGSGVMVFDQGKGTIEKCVISGNAKAGVQISKGGNPIVRDCKIRDGKDRGVIVYDHGKGTFEKCVISRNASVGVAITTGGNPIVRDCEIRDGKNAGVFVYEQGQGTFEKCVISRNASVGVAITTGGNPTVRYCQIRDGKGSGVFVYEDGEGTIEACVISGHANGGIGITTGGNPTVRDCDVREK